VWLSSPVSGPQRFEYELDCGAWLQIRTKAELVALLVDELNEHFRVQGTPKINLKL